MTLNLIEPEFISEYTKSNRFSCGNPRNFTVINPNPTHRQGAVLFLRSDDQYDSILNLWVLDLENSKETKLITAKELINSNKQIGEELDIRERLREQSNGITSYSLDTSGEKITFQINGSLYLFKIETHELIEIESGLAFSPKISPDGNKIAYCENQSLLCVTTDDNWKNYKTITLLISSDSNIVYGQAEFIAAEEMGRTEGFWWSPESTEILATKTNNEKVDQYWLSDPTDPSKKPIVKHYPFAGTTNTIVDLIKINLTGSQEEIEWRAHKNLNFEYLNKVLWTEEKPLVVIQTRDQKTQHICKLSNNELETILEIKNLKWVENIPTSPLQFEDHLITIQDTDRQRSLFFDNEKITPENLYVRSILGAKNNLILFEASSDPGEIDIYEIDVSTKCWNKLSNSQGVLSGKYSNNIIIQIENCIDQTRSNFRVYETEDSFKPVKEFTIENRSGSPQLVPEPSYFNFENINMTVLLPSWHNNEKLPVIMCPYGGPHAQLSLHSKKYHLFNQWLANQGYLVVIADGRGTPGVSSKHEREIYHDLKPIVEDQIKALEHIFKIFRFANTKSVGIRGWSFGGYLSALAVIEYPDIFHAGIAGAPVTDWKLYDTHYTERYLGKPQDNPETYDKNSLLNKADKLKRPLMIIHGLADDNVLIANSLQLSNQLTQSAILHTAIYLSEVTHMQTSQKITNNIIKLELEFFKQNLMQVRN